MPTPTQRRRALVRDLLARYDVPSQAALAQLLAERGVSADQSTLSRDLRELGVVKTPTGYALPGDVGAASPPQGLDAAARQWLLGATSAQNLVVLRTPPGGAQALAVALDGTRHPSIVGTIAGDDTVLVVCPDARAARALCRELEAAVSPAAPRESTR